MNIGEQGDSSDVGMRDAFHVPAILCESDESLKPGDEVLFVDEGAGKVARPDRGDPIHGVVDPFLPFVEKDKAFWVLLAPGIVEKFRHTFETRLPVGRQAYDKAQYSPTAEEGADEDDGDDECKGCW